MTTVPRKTKGSADKVDKYAGAVLRNLRMQADMSQETLASHVDVTFQQVQKYERGTNRMSASRLYTFANLFGVTTDSFLPDRDGQTCMQLIEVLNSKIAELKKTQAALLKINEITSKLIEKD